MVTFVGQVEASFSNAIVILVDSDQKMERNFVTSEHSIESLLLRCILTRLHIMYGFESAHQ
jgi:hypothetical protein